MNETFQQDNDESGRLQRMLEDVTRPRHAPRDAAHDQDDLDATGMREAWLAFGRLLEAANAAELPPCKEPRKKLEPPRRHVARAFAAAAAALFLALGLGWWFAHDGRQIKPDVPLAVHPREVAPQISAPRAPTIVHDNATITKEKIAAKPTSAASNSTWDEGIETQITSVSQQIDAVEETWQHRVDDADLVQYRIDEVTAGLNSDGL